MLDRVKNNRSHESWTRFVDLYAPLIFHWARSRGLNATDAADLSQDVFATLVTKLAEFEYDQNQSFRGWLYTVTANRANNWHRQRAREPVNEQPIADSELAETPGDDPVAEAEYRSYLIQRALEIMQTEFETRTWKACWLTTVEEYSVADAARETRLSENAVRISKCRVLRRLRQELDGLLE